MGEGALGPGVSGGRLKLKGPLTSAHHITNDLSFPARLHRTFSLSLSLSVRFLSDSVGRQSRHPPPYSLETHQYAKDFFLILKYFVRRKEDEEGGGRTRKV